MTLFTDSPRPPRARLRLRAAFACAAAAAVLTAAVLPMPAAAADRPPSEFGGTWQLDLKESETLQQKLDALRASGGGSGFHGGGGGWHGGMGGGAPTGGTGGHHGGYGGAPGEGGGHGAGRDSTRRAWMAELAHPPMTLQIEPGDDTFVLSERGLAVEVLVLGDGAGAALIQPDAPHAQAQWKGKHLVAEMVGPRGGRMTQELELSDRDTKLTILTRIEGREGRPPLELRRVYNRSEGDESEPPYPEPLPPAAPPDSSRR